MYEVLAAGTNIRIRTLSEAMEFLAHCGRTPSGGSMQGIAKGIASYMGLSVEHHVIISLVGAYHFTVRGSTSRQKLALFEAVEYRDIREPSYNEC